MNTDTPKDLADVTDPATGMTPREAARNLYLKVQRFLEFKDGTAGLCGDILNRPDTCEFYFGFLAGMDALALPGIVETIRRYHASRSAAVAEENKRLRIALADAINRPMGVVPDSAAEFYKPESEVG